MKGKAFVTGGSSDIGARVIERLATDHHVVALRRRREVPVAPELPVSLVDGSLEDIAELADVINDVDVVVHVAGLSHSDDPHEYHRVNTGLTGALLDCCASGQRFVYVSSRAAVEGGGPYAASKLAAEQAVTSADVDGVIVRPGEVWGAAEPEAIDRMLAAAGRLRLLVDIRAPEAPSYAPIAADVCAQIIAEAVRRGRSGAPIIAAAPEALTSRDIQRVLARAGRRVLRVPVPASLVRRAARSGLVPGIVPDQVERLLAPKPRGNSEELLGLTVEPFADVIVRLYSR